MGYHLEIPCPKEELDPAKLWHALQLPADALLDGNCHWIAHQLRALKARCV